VLVVHGLGIQRPASAIRLVRDFGTLLQNQFVFCFGQLLAKLSLKHGVLQYGLLGSDPCLEFGNPFGIICFTDLALQLRYPVKLGNGKEEMELEILEEIIQQNYIKIIEDVNAILKKIEDKLKEKSAVPPTGTHKTEQKIIR